MFPVFSSICSNSKEMGNSSIYSQMSCATQNVIVFHTCAQNCCCPCKSQQLDVERGRGCCGPFLAGVTQVESLLLFPLSFCSLRESWGSTRLKFPFVFFCFSPEGVASEAAFCNLKTAPRQTLQISVCMQHHHSTRVACNKEEEFKDS